MAIPVGASWKLADKIFRPHTHRNNILVWLPKKLRQAEGHANDISAISLMSCIVYASSGFSIQVTLKLTIGIQPFARTPTSAIWLFFQPVLSATSWTRPRTTPPAAVSTLLMATLVSGLVDLASCGPASNSDSKSTYASNLSQSCYKACSSPSPPLRAYTNMISKVYYLQQDYEILL